MTDVERARMLLGMVRHGGFGADVDEVGLRALADRLEEGGLGAVARLVRLLVDWDPFDDAQGQGGRGKRGRGLPQRDGELLAAPRRGTFAAGFGILGYGWELAEVEVNEYELRVCSGGVPMVSARFHARGRAFLPQADHALRVLKWRAACRLCDFPTDLDVIATANGD